MYNNVFNKRNINKFLFKIKENKLKFSVGLLVLLAVIGAAVYFFIDFSPKKVYAVAVMVRNQQSADPIEDARSSLKAGDVLVVVDENHVWSQLESASYLILKMKLHEKQAQKLLQPKEKVIKKSESSEEKQGPMSIMGSEQKETVVARAYRIRLEKFKNFNPDVLMNGQPYLDKVYGWGIVEKK